MGDQHGCQACAFPRRALRNSTIARVSRSQYATQARRSISTSSVAMGFPSGRVKLGLLDGVLIAKDLVFCPAWDRGRDTGGRRPAVTSGVPQIGPNLGRIWIAGPRNSASCKARGSRTFPQARAANTWKRGPLAGVKREAVSSKRLHDGGAFPVTRWRARRQGPHGLRIAPIIAPGRRESRRRVSEFRQGVPRGGAPRPKNVRAAYVFSVR